MKQFEHIKTYLVEQKRDMLNRTSEFRTANEMKPETRADEAELAAQDTSITLSLQLHERDRSLLYKIERALSKFEDGSFGQCESCGESISQKRIEARPFSSLCIDCKEEEEDTQRSFLV